MHVCGDGYGGLENACGVSAPVQTVCFGELFGGGFGDAFIRSLRYADSGRVSRAGLAKVHPCRGRQQELCLFRKISEVFENGTDFGRALSEGAEFDMADMHKYDVFEYFHSFQGEGAHSGRSAFFIRLFGCPIRCPWCDSAGTWGGPDGNAQVKKIAAEELAASAVAANPDFVVITGGEPAIHDLTALCDALHAGNLRVHLETSGAFPVRGNVDWITLSPKVNRLPTPENWMRAAELKLIVTEPKDLDFWAEKISRERVSSDAPIWLHPEWSRHDDPEVLGAISDWICRYGFPFRAGWQLHKLFNVR